MTSSKNIRLVLFDLDGTLADTAPDLCIALNRLRRERGLIPLPHHWLRSYVSHGSNALIHAALGFEPEHPEFIPARQLFLDYYHARIAMNSQLFPGMNTLLLDLAQRDIRWGIVTNKPGWLTDVLVKEFSFAIAPSAVVSGTQVQHPKPHPDALFAACRQSGINVSQTLYIGDAARDVEAAHNAKMPCLLALFGYIHADDRPFEWGADGYIEEPQDVINWIEAK